MEPPLALEPWHQYVRTLLIPSWRECSSTPCTLHLNPCFVSRYKANHALSHGLISSVSNQERLPLCQHAWPLTRALCERFTCQEWILASHFPGHWHHKYIINTGYTVLPHLQSSGLKKEKKAENISPKHQSYSTSSPTLYATSVHPNVYPNFSLNHHKSSQLWRIHIPGGHEGIPSTCWKLCSFCFVKVSSAFTFSSSSCSSATFCWAASCVDQRRITGMDRWWQVCSWGLRIFHFFCGEVKTLEMCRMNFWTKELSKMRSQTWPNPQSSCSESWIHFSSISGW